ncbi:MAG TPA: PPC domain-containing protein [Gemmataceae bacterium]|nr:PPC domain-containing protein [Gemmataceae bacterium]
MLAGKTYVIDMSSPQFDTYLRLEDDKGKVVAENDDISPTNLNSRIVFTAPKDGAYRIVAT